VWRSQWVAKNFYNNQDTENKKDFLGVYIFLTSLRSYYEKYKPTNIICCWDEKPDYKPNPRKLILEQYKGNRNADDSIDIHCDNHHIKELIEAIGGINFYPRELEADDIMAFLCHKLPGTKVIITVDKDLIQLVNKDVIVFSPMKKIEYTSDNVDQLLGHAHEHFVTYKAFQGDQSDNIPGVYRFGAKKIQQYINNEIVLTSEQQEVFDRNMKLMDLNHGYSQYPEEEEHYKQQLLNPYPKQDWDKFMYICKDLNFQKIVTSKEKWFETFFQDNTMTNIISQLFK
jgi:5'-3' exonuclease